MFLVENLDTILTKTQTAPVTNLHYTLFQFICLISHIEKIVTKKKKIQFVCHVFLKGRAVMVHLSALSSFSASSLMQHRRAMKHLVLNITNVSRLKSFKQR